MANNVLSKIRLLQHYVVLWIHIIKAICRISHYSCKSENTNPVYLDRYHSIIVVILVHLIRDHPLWRSAILTRGGESFAKRTHYNILAKWITRNDSTNNHPFDFTFRFLKWRVTSLIEFLKCQVWKSKELLLNQKR